MSADRVVTVDLGDGNRLALAVEQIGPTMVADEAITAKLAEITSSIEKIGRETLDALKRIEPSKATVELSFKFALEAGHVLALLTKASGDASIKATLEWSREPPPGKP